MLPRRTALAALALTVLVVAAAVVAAGGWRGEDADAGAHPSPISLAPPATPGSIDAGAADAGSEAIGRTTDSTAADQLRPGSDPASASAGSDPTAALVTALPPRTASRQGALVAGFPASVIPVVSGSSVRSSGVSPTRGSVQVSLVADTERSPDAVLTSYRRSLQALAFVESEAPAVPGAEASQFVRGDDQLVVTISRAGRTTSYSVFGTLHTRARG